MFGVNNNAASVAQAQPGPELEEIQTEAVGFQAISGETKLRLLPTGWPASALPKPTSTLFGVASRQELVAAAGPDTLVIARTITVREAYDKDVPAENNIKPFTPELTIPIPRISHLAFSSDESFLIICAEEGGGLQVYDVNGLKQGNTNPAFQLATNGVSIRALVPNPAPENGHIIALVLTDGKLMLADLKSRNFQAGKNGMVLREGVSCISWSVRGKQIVAGLGNGTALQLDPSGDVKAEIPRPPQLDGDQYMSGISWLGNDLFWTIYTPSNPNMEHTPDSTFMMVTRAPKTTNFQFQKMQDPCPPFGMKRTPQHHFNVRLKDFPPNLDDVIVVAGTASGDVGLITKSKVALSQQSQHTANIYTTTSMAVDSRRAQLPMSDDMTADTTDTSPIGVAWDMSTKTPVKRPIPSEEIEQSNTPLPALMVLNHDGILSTWWFVYNESVRQGTAYPGLLAVSSGQFSATSTPQAGQGSGAFGQSQSSQNAFGQSAGSTSSVFGKPATSAFGQPATSAFGQPATPAFGQPSTPAFGAASALGGSQGSKIPVSAFGASTALGGNKSLWGAASTTPQTGGTAFGAPAFGSTSQLGGFAKPAQPAGTAFGSSGGLGQTQSPWGAAPASGGSAFGTGSDKSANVFGGNASSQSPFVSLGASGNGNAGGFSNTSAQSPFGQLGAASNNKPFGTAFGGTTSNASPFATQAEGKPSIFGQTPGFGTASTPAFGAPAPSTNVFATPANKAPENPASPEAEMTDDMEMNTAPTSANSPAKPTFGLSSAPFKLSPAFKPDNSVKDDRPSTTGSSLFGAGFGSALPSAQKPAQPPVTPIKEEPKSPQIASATSTTPHSPLPSAAAPPAKGGFVKGANELKPFVPPTQTALTETPKQNTTARVEEPPLPPSPKITRAPPDDNELSPAGSPPIDLGAPGSDSLSPVASLGSEEDAVVKEEEAPLPPDFTLKESSIPKPTWSLPSTTPSKDKRPASPSSNASPGQGVSQTPLSIPPTTASHTPASVLNPQYTFQPSPSINDSPRSPSPTRSSRFGAPSGLLTPRPAPPGQLFSTTPIAPPPTKSAPATKSSFFNGAPSSDSSTRLPDPQQSRPEAPQEPQELVDDEADKIREELAGPVEPTKRLAPFLAHQDYVGKVTGDGVPSQVEKVYRDINSMVDTLGLNARSLASFIKGHSELYPDGGRDRADLEDDDDWCLMEIEDLGVLQKEMTEQLEAERLTEVREKVSELQDVQRGLSKLRMRHHDLQKLLNARKAKDNNARGEQLSTEQLTVLSGLRKDFIGFQQLLAQAEESISLLRTKLASIQQSNGSAQSSAVPTAEAVISTIVKMTRMIEQKSGDIDLLESQMRKLKFKPQARNARAGTPTALDEALGRLTIGSPGNGRGDSPFQTPPSSRSKLGASRAGTFALTFSPDTSDDEGMRSSFRSSMRSSVGAGGKRQTKLPKVTEEDVKAYAASDARKKRVMQLLKDKILERGTRVQG